VLRTRLGRILLLTVSVAGFTLATRASAAIVSGNFVYRDGTPAGNRQLHFENQVSHDMFIASTGADGAFKVDLPPGTYDLRAERGVVLKPDIVITSGTIDIGRSVEPAPLDYRRPFEHEGLQEPPYLTSAAPATANVHGRPMESLTLGHRLVQLLRGAPAPLAPLPPEGTGPNPYAPETSTPPQASK